MGQIEDYKNRVRQDVTDQDDPLSIPPTVIGKKFTELADIVQKSVAQGPTNDQGLAQPDTDPGTPTTPERYQLEAGKTYAHFLDAAGLPIIVPLKVGEKYVYSPVAYWDTDHWELLFDLMDVPGLEDYLNKIEVEALLPTGLEVATGFTVDNGHYVNKTGVITANASFKNMLVPYNGTDQIYVSAVISGSDLALATYKNSSGATIGFQNPGTNGIETPFVDFHLTVPNGTTQIFINSIIAGAVIIKKPALLPIATKQEVVDVNSKVVVNTQSIDNITTGIADYGDPLALTIIDGSYVNNSGSIIVDSARRYTQIAITDKDRIKASGVINGAAMYFIIYRNAAGSIIGRECQGINGSNTIYTDYVLSIPPGATTLIVQGLVTNQLIVYKKYIVPLSTKAELATVQADVSAKGIQIAVVKDLLSDFMEVDPGSLTTVNGAYMTGNTATTNASYKYVSFAVSVGDRVKVSSVINGSGLFLAAYKNAAGVYLSREQQGVNGVNTPYTDFELTIPTGTATIYLNALITAITSVKKYTSQKAATKIELTTVQQLLSDYKAIDNGFITTVPGSYMAGSGANVNANYKYISFAATAGDKIAVNSVIAGSALYLAVYKNAGGALISREQQGVDGTNTTFTDFLLTIPAGTATIYINGLISASIIPKKFVQQQAATKSDLLRLTASYWLQKLITWFGTSIPAYGTDTSYPKLVGNILGATVDNMAYGSSMARRGHLNITANDPYGWTGLAWQNVAYSLGQTLAEKEDLIINWESKWSAMLGGSFVGEPGTVKPTVLTELQKETFRSLSYERRLIPELEKKPDLIAWDHGHNDAFFTLETDQQMYTIPADSRNRNTYLGAMNFLIDLAYSYNPRQRMVIIGHYENDVKTRISLAQEALAKYRGIPLIRTWEEAGISSQQIYTNWHWDGFNWVLGTEWAWITQKGAWLKDLLHPDSLAARQMFAGIHATKINLIR